MKMGLNNISALDVINKLEEVDLKSIIRVLGDEKEASIIAKKHSQTTKHKKDYKKTSDLVELIKKSKKKIILIKQILVQKLFKH